MIRYLAALMLVTTSAFAQEAPPAFVPYQVDQQSHVAMMNFLQDVPARYAIPLMQTLTQLEQKAVEAAKKPKEVSGAKPK